MDNSITPVHNPSSPFDSIRQIDDQGNEYWSARDLQTLLKYARWENFEDAIERAIIACKNSGQDIAIHLRDVTKTSPMPNGGAKEINDYHFSRYGCYLVAMNGDPRKEEISQAQTYFTIKTRQAETLQEQIAQLERIVQSLVERLDKPRATKTPLPFRARKLGPAKNLEDHIRRTMARLNRPVTVAKLQGSYIKSYDRETIRITMEKLVQCGVVHMWITPHGIDGVYELVQ